MATGSSPVCISFQCCNHWQWLHKQRIKDWVTATQVLAWKPGHSSLICCRGQERRKKEKFKEMSNWTTTCQGNKQKRWPASEDVREKHWAVRPKEKCVGPLGLWLQKNLSALTNISYHTVGFFLSYVFVSLQYFSLSADKLKLLLASQLFSGALGFFLPQDNYPFPSVKIHSPVHLSLGSDTKWTERMK